MSDIVSLFDGQHSPWAMFALGAVGMLVAMTLLRLVRRIRRLIWTAALLATASGMGAGGGWMFLDALKTWR